MKQTPRNRELPFYLAPAPTAPIAGLTDPRFVYIPHREHTLDGFRARMEKYRRTEQLKGKQGLRNNVLKA